jgi:hypothetical protein
MIRVENGKYVVYSEKGRKFGTYDTQDEANKRLRQMEAFKHMKKTASEPNLKNFFSPEPTCKVLGTGKRCVYGKAPSYAKPGGLKKAEYVFNKLAQQSMKPIRADAPWHPYGMTPKTSWKKPLNIPPMKVNQRNSWGGAVPARSNILHYNAIKPVSPEQKMQLQNLLDSAVKRVGK